MNIKKQEGKWNGFTVRRYLIPEFYYKDKPWKDKKLHQILDQEIMGLEGQDYEYIPYSLFRTKIGEHWKQEPFIELMSEQIWKKLAKQYAHFYGVVVRDGSRFFYHEWLKERALRLKYIGIVAHNFSKSYEELEEHIYDELGLWILGATKIEELSISLQQPLLILDASKEPISNLSNIPEYSVWLDLCADNRKRGRIEKRYPRIQYISLKKELETVQYLDIE